MKGSGSIMILAEYKADFQPLSLDHERLIQCTDDILNQYTHNVTIHPTYAVIGTFGAGKTQFLYNLHRKSLGVGLLPIFILAEDLFSEIIRTDTTFTQGDVATLVNEKVRRVLGAIDSPDKSKAEIRQSISAITDPRGIAGPLLDDLLEKDSGKFRRPLRFILLVDELEGQYRTLQHRVQTPGDRSPLRELFEAPFLKFFSLAPAGIYEMGGADQTRALRLVIPAADIHYVRTKLVPQTGRANACWWLSRGKARHLFKACSALREAPANLGAPQAARIIREELDQIGQPPTEVPPAVTERLPPSKLPFLLNLGPLKRHHVVVITSMFHHSTKVKWLSASWRRSA